jgi:SAM-dependent methyltransferase
MEINDEIIDLLKCNLNNVNLIDTIGVDGILKCIDDYSISTNEHRNYLTDNSSLSNWYEDGIVYPNVSEYMKPVIDVVKNYKPYSILEAGAGGGKLSKMVYDLMDGDVDLHCVENNTEHYNQMLKNFNELIFEPKRIIKAKTYLSSIDNMSEFEDNKFNLTYTHTVMMHIPYISAILSAKELARDRKSVV